MDIVRHWLIPHEKNNFKAKVVHFHSLLTYLLFAVALNFFVNGLNARSNVLGFATDITSAKLVQLTNEKRAENGLPPLQYNEQLSVAAQKKAEDMFARDYWAHYGPDGTTPWSFILDSGYKYEFAGENLAKNFMFSDGVVQAWMDSPSHRENILRSEYTDVGFAIVNGTLNGEETTLVVQMFGTPFGGVAVAEAGDTQAQPATEGNGAEIQAEQPVQTGDEEIVVNKPQVEVLANQSNGTMSLSRIFYNTNLLFIGFLIVAFLLDFFVAVKLNIIHMHFGGKHLFHVLFLVFILIGLVIAANGKII